MKTSLLRFNHWRIGDGKMDAIAAPKTVNDAVNQRQGKVSASQDCSADPCSCTGCSEWD